MPAFAGSIGADAPAIRITTVVRIERRDLGDTFGDNAAQGLKHGELLQSISGG
jgi:hypothetical protein